MVYIYNTKGKENERKGEIWIKYVAMWAFFGTRQGEQSGGRAEGAREDST